MIFRLFLVIFLVAFSLNVQPQSNDVLLQPKQAKILGISLLEADMDKVRQQLSDLGGFQQDRATVNHKNLDKFFAYSHLRDSYYVAFEYDANGKVASVKRLFRKSGKHLINEYRDLQTEDVARQMIKTYGQPQQVLRKTRDGMYPYRAFIWQDDQMTITLDRVGSDGLAPIFVQYVINRDRYVEKTPEPVNANPRRRI